MSMKPEYKERWLKALRSGDYKQGKHKLTDGESFCCLGVLCDLVKEELHEGWECKKVSGGYVELHFDGRYDLLPDSVQHLVGLEKDNPTVHIPGYIDGTEWDKDLSELNDEGWTFEEIAKLIEAQL